MNDKLDLTELCLSTNDLKWIIMLSKNENYYYDDYYYYSVSLIRGSTDDDDAHAMMSFTGFISIEHRLTRRRP